MVVTRNARWRSIGLAIFAGGLANTASSSINVVLVVYFTSPAYQTVIIGVLALYVCIPRRAAAVAAECIPPAGPKTGNKQTLMVISSALVLRVLSLQRDGAPLCGQGYDAPHCCSAPSGPSGLPDRSSI